MPFKGKIMFAGPVGGRGTKRAALPFLFLAAISSGGIAASGLILKFAPAPFFWLWLTWAAVFWAAMFGVYGSWPRAILFNLGVVACLLAGTEAYYFSTANYIPPTVSNGLYVDDDVLGWAPVKGAQAHAIEVAPAGLFHHPVGHIFDATYTIGSDGLRVAPPYREGDLAGTVLFFGCSFTFGEGLGDKETLPYLVSAESGGRYRTFNFGVDGYSPAQMLAAIEHGTVRRVVDTTPQYAYYLAIPHHVWRVAGRVAWIHHEPRYVINPDGTLQRAGYFEDHKPLALRLGLGGRVAWYLNKSATWRVLTLPESQITDEDILLYLAIVRRSRELLTAQYPGIQFRVILWPGDHPWQESTYGKMRDGFLRMGISPDLVEDIIPGYKTNKRRFTLSSGDTHPNALANHLLAQYVLNEIAR